MLYTHNVSTLFALALGNKSEIGTKLYQLVHDG